MFDLTLHGNRRLPLLLAGALLLSVAPAGAQQSPPAAEPQQQSQQERAQQTPSGQMGKEEPSSHAPTAPDHVFVNGALAVPGASKENDMVPAKFSAKNAADDALITVAYTFKTLTPEQRRAIYDSLRGKPTGLAFNADVGTELPASVDLHAVPDDVAKQVPQTKDYQFAVANDRVLLVSSGRIVAGVFEK
jgi:hypothetical protein